MPFSDHLHSVFSVTEAARRRTALIDDLNAPQLLQLQQRDRDHHLRSSSCSPIVAASAGSSAWSLASGPYLAASMDRDCGDRPPAAPRPRSFTDDEFPYPQVAVSLGSPAHSELIVET